MNKGVQFEALGKKLFPTNPSALAFKRSGAFEGFVLSRATDRLVRLVLDANGKPTINAPLAAGDPGNVVRIEVGVDAAGDARNSSPEGVVINGTDTRAYVMNLVSRDVSVIDISGNDPSKYKEIARIASAALPTDAFALQGAARQGAVQHLDRPRGHATTTRASRRAACPTSAGAAATAATRAA